jgi:GNAT superfamily N-acetyltransferase
MHTVKLIESDKYIASTFDVMKQLRADLSEQTYVAQVRRQEAQGYRLAALSVEGRVRAVAGFRLSESLAWGRHIYVDDLVSDGEERSRGYGAALLKWVADYGREQGCKQLHLDSGVQRHGAHRFYLRERMDIVFYHFRRDL